MGLLSRIRSQGPVSAEIRRKALHLCAGAASLSFPAFLSDPRRVVAATLLMLAWMLAVRVVPVLQRRFGCVLHETDRSTHGELYFALGIAVLLLLPHANPLWYVAPVLVP